MELTSERIDRRDWPVTLNCHATRVPVLVKTRTEKYNSMGWLFSSNFSMDPFVVVSAPETSSVNSNLRTLSGFFLPFLPNNGSKRDTREKRLDFFYRFVLHGRQYSTLSDLELMRLQISL